MMVFILMFIFLRTGQQRSQKNANVDVMCELLTLATLDLEK